MLIRETTDATFECITQEQHAFLSGLLAGAWEETRLDPRLVQINGLHDTPWRRADAEPQFNPDTGLPHDFITYPMDQKVELYRTGLDELEEIDPLAAYLVSKHYTTFSGTRDHEPLTGPERQRRGRLETLLRADEDVERALEWIKFFDILSLYICMTGPRAEAGAIPRWLTGDGWQTSPDDVELALDWTDDETLTLGQWPFVGDHLVVSPRMRVLEARYPNELEMSRAWRASRPERRDVVLRPRD